VLEVLIGQMTEYRDIDLVLGKGLNVSDMPSFSSQPAISCITVPPAVGMASRGRRVAALSEALHTRRGQSQVQYRCVVPMLGATLQQPAGHLTRVCERFANGPWLSPPPAALAARNSTALG